MDLQVPCEENLQESYTNLDLGIQLKNLDLGCRYKSVLKEREWQKWKGSISWQTWNSWIEGKAVTHWDIFLVFQKSQRKKGMKSSIQKTVLLLSDQAGARSEKVNS